MGQPLRDPPREGTGERLRALHIERPADPPEESGGTKRWWAVAAVVGILAFGALWGLRAQAPSEVADTPVTVTAVEVPPDGGSVVLEASGFVTARRRATVSSQVTGRLMEVLAEEGDFVERGQILARLDASSARAELAQARAQRDATERSLEETRVRLRQAEVDLGRAQRLADEGILSDSELEAAQASVDVLRAQLERGVAQVGVTDSSLRVSQERLSDLVILAPFSGVVIDQAAQPGEMVSPVTAGGGFTRTGIFTVIDPDSLEIEVDVRESNIERIRPGQKAVARLDAYPDRPYAARVITTVPSADRTRATVRVRVGLEDPDPAILPEMGVRVTFLEGATESRGDAPSTHSSVAVPLTAVVGNEASGRAVYVVPAEGPPQRRPVTIDRVTGDRALLSAGLTAGEEVVADPGTEGGAG